MSKKSKKGKSIVLSTLMMILGFIVYLGLFTMALPNIVGLERFNSMPLWLQFIIFGASLIVCFVMHVIVYKVSSKRLEKVDF